MSILVCPGRHAVSLAEVRRPSHAITLASPDADVPDLAVPHRLILRFHDIAEPREGLVAPDATLIARLLDFAEAWRAEAAPLLIHCHAGVSRSTAAAYAVACARAGPRAESMLARQLRILSPSATPNPLIVALADARLGRGGAMSRAVSALGRGADCFEGEAFELPVPHF